MTEFDSDEERRQRQLQARARLRERTKQLREEDGADSASFEGRPTTKELVGDDDGYGAPRDRRVDAPSEAAEPYDDPSDREDPSRLRDNPGSSERRYHRRRASRDDGRKSRESRESDSGEEKNAGGGSSLFVRARSGVIYIAITVVCVLVSDITMVLMLMAVAGICAHEFYSMIRADAKLPNEVLGIIAAVLYPPAMYFYGLTGAMLVTVAFLVALLVWYVFWMRSRIADVGVSLFGAMYTGLFLSGLVIVQKTVGFPWGGVAVLQIFFSAWINDVFAYLVGGRFGRHKLAPLTSPKKSWEGFAAGLVGSVIFWLAMSFVPGIDMPIVMAIIFGLICGGIEVIGDLAESRIKRNTGFKDSGTILPGHGGLLDRCDSLLFAAFASPFLLIVGGCIPNVIFG